MSRSPVPLDEQRRAAAELSAIQEGIGSAQPIVEFGKHNFVPARDVRKLAMRLASEEDSTLVVVRDGAARIESPRRVLLLSTCGVLRLTPVPREADKTFGVEVNVVAVWGRSVLKVGDGDVAYLGCAMRNLQRFMFRFPTMVRWQRLEEAHTPFYNLCDITTWVVVEHWTARSIMCGVRLPNRRFCVMKVSEDGYGCLRCGACFPSTREWVDHYGPSVKIPHQLVWSSIRFSDTKKGQLDLQTLRRLPTPSSFMFKQLPEHTKKTLESPTFNRAVMARGREKFGLPRGHAQGSAKHARYW